MEMQTVHPSRLNHVTSTDPAHRDPLSADERPDFLTRLGVLLPCSEEDVKAAYREKVKAAHPDHGGSREAFLQLEEDFQNSLQYATVQAGRRAWLATHIERYAAQSRFAAVLQSRGATVEFKSLPWLSREVGPDFAQVLDTIVGIHWNGPSITISEIRFLLRHVELLTQLRTLDLAGARIGNQSIALLAERLNLEQLDLSATCISNSAVKPLASFPQLKSVNIGKTFFGWTGRMRLWIARPHLETIRDTTMQNAPQRRYGLVLAVVLVYWALCFTATHIPHISIPDPDWPIPFDKLVHFSMFAGLAFLFSALGALRSLAHESNWRRYLLHAVLILGLAAAYAAFDERTQPAFSRTCDLYDWYADVAGALGGLVFFHIIRGIISLFKPAPVRMSTV
jgi:VanZ family protein